jgi:hypothetical protein
MIDHELGGTRAFEQDHVFDEAASTAIDGLPTSASGLL